MQDVFIIDGARTPFIKAGRTQLPLLASDLTVSLCKSLFNNLSFSVEKLEQMVMGCVMPDTTEANIARIIALRLGLLESSVAYTVQRNCASGLQAIDSVFKDITISRHNLSLAGGVEVMSRAPFLFSDEFASLLLQLSQSKSYIKKLKILSKIKFKNLIPVFSLLKGLKDQVIGMSMGDTAEKLSNQFEITRKEMDEYALLSHQKAVKFQNSELIKQELIPVFDHSGNIYEIDTGIRQDTDINKLAKLKPTFVKPFGNITAGNSSQITDGAAVLLLGSKKAIEENKLKSKIKIVDIVWSGLDPTIMGLGPAYAIEKLLAKNNLKLSDNTIGIVEINEAFAGQVLACIKYFQKSDFTASYGELNLGRFNPHGGAIAIGHPVGASGARLVLHVSKHLENTDFKYGIASLCIGGGQGGAILLEKVGD